MDALTVKTQEIRRLHQACREKNAALKGLAIACRQAIIMIDNQQQPDADLRAQWVQALYQAEEMF